MINLQHLFQDFFADDDFSLTELVGTGGDWVGRMTTTNPGAIFTPSGRAATTRPRRAGGPDR